MFDIHSSSYITILFYLSTYLPTYHNYVSDIFSSIFYRWFYSFNSVLQDISEASCCVTKTCEVTKMQRPIFDNEPITGGFCNFIAGAGIF